MKDDLISLFIDDEMGLDDKIEFVETVHESESFSGETIDLLHQEKILTSQWVTRMPAEQIKTKQNIFPRWFQLRPILVFSTVLVAFVVTLFLYYSPGIISGVDPNLESNIKKQISYRFVIYRPNIQKAEIIGSFTDWQPVRLDRLSSSGYWAITLNLSEGEHRYSYLIGDGQQIADPTVMLREKDDFGGVNSIIEIKRVI
jgi:hypothetical protein